jgi:hypothetical protein
VVEDELAPTTTEDEGVPEGCVLVDVLVVGVLVVGVLVEEPDGFVVGGGLLGEVTGCTVSVVLPLEASSEPPGVGW